MEASTESVDRSADSIAVTEGETDGADTAASREGRHIALQALQFKRYRTRHLVNKTVLRERHILYLKHYILKVYHLADQ